jgi:1,2-diacylglycerol-3-alpha-glucose alpha-1,2-galactosyltransferase
MTVNIVSESIFFKAQGVHTAFLMTVRLLKKRGIKVSVNSLFPADITHIHTFFPFAFLKLITAKHSVITAHLTPESLLGSLKGDKVMYAIAKRYLPYFYNKADLLLAVSPMVKDDLIALGVKTRIELFPNPIDASSFKKDAELRKAGRRRLELPDDAFAVMGCGQVQSRKGISDFIKMAKQFPESTFIWVGSTPFKSLTATDKEMEDLLAHPPGNFSLKGPYEYDDMPEVFNAADIFYFPSLQETAGLVIIEGAACGLPLVLRDLPPYRTLFAGTYTPCDNFGDFEKEIKRLHDDKGYYKKQQEASASLAEKYSIDTLGDSLIRYYESIL